MMWQKIKHYIVLAGGAFALLVSFILGSNYQKNKAHKAKIKEQQKIINRNTKRNQEWKDIDEKVSKKNAHITQDNVSDELNKLFPSASRSDVDS